MISIERTLMALLGGVALMLALNNMSLKDEVEQLKKDIIYNKAVFKAKEVKRKNFNDKNATIHKRINDDIKTLDNANIGDIITF